MKVILSGATGFAGNEVLRQALLEPAVEEVLVLTRRSLGMQHPRLREIVLKDFLDLSGVDFSGYAACIWCLGVSQGAVSEEEYIRITQDYAVTAATAMFRANPNLRFCFVSGRSADPSGKTKSRQARIKGRTETMLCALSPNVFVFRPGYIGPSAASGPRKDLGRFAGPIAAVMGLFIADFRIDCDVLAKALLQVAQHGGESHLMNNAGIRAAAGRN